MSDNDKYQSGWYESDEGHAFHAHGKDMSEETLAALKKLADAAYKHLDSLPDVEPEEDEEEDVCRNCGHVKELVADTPFCSMCYVMLGDDDDDWNDGDYEDSEWDPDDIVYEDDAIDDWEDPNEAIVSDSIGNKQHSGNWCLGCGRTFIDFDDPCEDCGRCGGCCTCDQYTEE